MSSVKLIMIFTRLPEQTPMLIEAVMASGAYGIVLI